VAVCPGGPDGEFEVGFDEPVDVEELPLGFVALGAVVTVEAADVVEAGESATLEPAPVTPLHPRPQTARVMSAKKSGKKDG
jgi:hypothetical protein